MARNPSATVQGEGKPWLFLPFGLAPAVLAGYLTVAVADEMARAGVPLASVSALVTAMFVPATLMFLWAPLVDLFGRRQRWLLAGVSMLCLAAAGLALVGRATSVLPLLVALGALGGFGYSLVSAAQKGLAVELFAPSRRIAAAGWAGAGSGIGLAAGGGMVAASAHLSPLGTALLLIALVGLPPLIAVAAFERFTSSGPRESTLRTLANDAGRLLGSRPGLLAMAICVLPFASRGAALMVGALGMDFAATAEFVAGRAGPGKSLAFAAGVLLGARLWKWIGTRRGYLISGIGFVAFSLNRADWAPDADGLRRDGLWIRIPAGSIAVCGAGHHPRDGRAESRSDAGGRPRCGRQPAQRLSATGGWLGTRRGRLADAAGGRRGGRPRRPGRLPALREVAGSAPVAPRVVSDWSIQPRMSRAIDQHADDQPGVLPDRLSIAEIATARTCAGVRSAGACSKGCRSPRVLRARCGTRAARDPRSSRHAARGSRVRAASN